MAIGDIPVTITGNLIADPEVRFTPNGKPVANFRVANTPRKWDSNSGQYVEGEAVFINCNLWNKQAENLAQSLHKGDRVIVTGRLRQRSYDDKNGQTRTVTEIEADEVGASLKFATAQVTKSTGGQGRGNNWNQQQQGNWNQQNGQMNQQQAQQNIQQAFGSQQADPFGASNTNDEPPF